MANSEYTYEVLTTQQCELALASACHIFSQDEPLAKHLGITKEELTKSLRPMFELGAKSGISQCVTVTTTGEMVGVLLATNWGDELNLVKEQGELLASLSTEKLDCIQGLMGVIEDKFLDLVPIKLGQGALMENIGHIFMRTVEFEHRGKGIAKIMNSRMLQCVEELHLKAVFSSSTNLRSRKILAAQGAEEWASIDYNEYAQLDGDERAPFRQMGNPLADRLALM
eukprot:Awhi_evm1s1561